MNLFELFVKIGVDDQASGQLKSIGEKLGGGLKTAGKIGVAAVGTAATAISALTGQAVKSFSEYEQLASGAQKIFNDMDFSRIAADANNAYKELGLSANQYLAVINDVGATFAATMGDEAGYNAAKQGLKAISDYASGTGKNVDELSQKFTLITRSTASYQSIADQFSGILPATSAGFLEQAQAAGILSDSYTQLTEVPIDEYQAAVSAMLESGVEKLGLANNTANEAATTISGSLTATKAAWSNLITGFADENADFDSLMDNFVESASNAAKNILPRVGQALNGIGKVVTELAPVISTQLPVLISDVLPGIVSASISLLSALGTGLIENLPMLFENVTEILSGLLDALIANAPMLVKGAFALIGALGLGLLEAAPELLLKAVELIAAVISAIGNTVGQWIEAGITLLSEFATGVYEGFLELMAKIGDWVDENIIQPIKDKFSDFVDVGRQVIDKIKEGISNAWEGLKTWFNSLWDSLFGNRTVNVSANVSTNGSHAGGLAYVPFDGYIAELHKGERVLTASEAREYNRGASANNTSGITIIQNIQSVPQTPVEFAAATEAYFEQARWAMA